MQDFLISIAVHWIKEYHIDGWRLDVSDEVSHYFWRRFRQAVKAANPECAIIGENWHNANTYLQGDQYDSIIAPAREDVAAQVGGLSETINNNLMAGRIAVMPSTKAVAQIWTPAQTFFSDLAKDPFRLPEEQKYLTDEALQKGLKKVDEQIYSAIHTLN